MPDENTAKTKAPAATPAAPAEIDLSAEIVATLEAPIGETVRCVRVYGDNYRCNWWGQEAPRAIGKPIVSGFEATELRVRRSRFLKVKKTSDGLQIQDATSRLPVIPRPK
ncbi:MAG: hypothetical protein ABSB42_18315 [Tepidisphaeraceae bacterium]|jgi:hypothetical protein